MKSARPAGTTLCLAGLGNPGRDYAGNRHNAGRLLVDFLQTKWSAVSAGVKADCDVWRAEVHRTPIMLAAPHSYMNLSGQPLTQLVRTLDISLDCFMLLHDEIDLPFGRLQLKRGGSAAGHRGVASVYQSIGSTEFFRLRIGVGRPDGSTRDYVLSDFSDADRQVLQASFDRLLDGLNDWITGETARAAQKINTDVSTLEK